MGVGIISPPPFFCTSAALTPPILCHKNVTRRFSALNHKMFLVSSIPPSEEELEVALHALTLLTGQDRSTLLRNMVLRELQFALPPMNNFS